MNTKKIKISLIASLVVVSSFVLFPSLVSASSFIFKNRVVTGEEGKIFTIPVLVDPVGKKNYTVRLDLAFSPDVLEVVSFVFNPRWFTVPQSGYDLINNKSGQFTKTGGYPGGFSSITPFGTVTFRVKKVAQDLITVGAQSIILNAEGRNVLVVGPSSTIMVAVINKQAAAVSSFRKEQEVVLVSPTVDTVPDLDTLIAQESSESVVSDKKILSPEESSSVWFGILILIAIIILRIKHSQNNK